jgi:DeoR/GlpR family transcriptional regulator of sugar metabolism
MTRIRDTSEKPESTYKGDASTSRASRIMDILKDGGVLGIKDIAANLPEYSEKMIQRDLAFLVKQNQVRKSGAKRWSRYSLVQ